MLAYLIKRLLLLIPTWIAISLLAFGLSKCTPGDPVVMFISEAGPGQVSGDPSGQDRVYLQTASYLGLDKPAFYFTIQPSAYPDTLYRVWRKSRRKALKGLLDQYGSWPAVESFHLALANSIAAPQPEFEEQVRRYPGWYSDQVKLIHSSRSGEIDFILRSWERKLGEEEDPGARGKAIQECIDAWGVVKRSRSLSGLYWPEIRWHGFDNQYHHWFTGFFKGDLGRSYRDGRPVSEKILEVLPWTLLLNGSAICLAILIALVSGVFMALRGESMGSRFLNVLYFMLFAVPVFWLGTLCLTFFTSPDYRMQWFPALGPVHFILPGETIPTAIARLANHLFLPVFCLTAGSLAFLSRQVRGSMKQALGQQMIQAARARGIPSRMVIWKHALQNALFPLITLLGSVFPALLAGSVVIEVIFNVYGMGMLTVSSISGRDWPTVFGILQLGALMTMAGILFSDLLYALADPRVRLDERNTVGLN